MQKTVILGAGESGIGAAVLSKKLGNDVFLSDISNISDEAKTILDNHNISYEEGQHTRELILDSQLVIKSPGIPDNIPIIDKIKESNIPIISEIEFAGKYDNAKKICVTGSNGKTTTSSLIYFLLKNAGFNVGLAGNIGQSYAYQVATCNYDYYVLELSSFQLDGMYDFKADIAVLLNITPDHLDRYNNNFDDYIKAKFRITQNMSQEDCFIFCADDTVTINQLSKVVMQATKLPFSINTEVPEGAYIRENQRVVSYNNDSCQMELSELSLKGKHNIYNSMAAAIAGKILKIDNHILRESLKSFRGIEHRLEKVLKIKDVIYINDSKATNVNSTWYALESIDTPIIWIAGGKDKGNDYSPVLELVKNRVKAIICLGLDNKKLLDTFSNTVDTIIEVKSAKEAVNNAYNIAKPGDTVLLSPACASFDLFKNYEDRGEQFKKAVKEL